MGASLLASVQSLFGSLLFAQEESFFSSWTFIILMAVVAAGLFGLLYYLRNKQDDE